MVTLVLVAMASTGIAVSMAGGAPTTPQADSAPPSPATNYASNPSAGPAMQAGFRTFLVDPYEFEEVVRPKLPVLKEDVDHQADGVFRALRQWFAQLGVDMALTNGRSILWHDDGRLLVCAPHAELETIERALDKMHRDYSGKPHPRLEIRVIHLKPESFEAGLSELMLLAHGARSQAEVGAAVVRRFAQIGVEFASPKTCYYSRSRSYLALCAPRADLDTIEREVLRLNRQGPGQ
jgi:hypothetical protein